MLQNDYLMRIIFQMIEVLRRSLQRQRSDPEATSEELEKSLANAAGIEPKLFFSLAPESMITLLSLGGFDPRLAGYLVRGMALDADLLAEAGHQQGAELRRSQLDALAKAYGLDVGPADLSPEGISGFLDEEAAGSTDNSTSADSDTNATTKKGTETA
ncbi:MAG: hypothetical protein FWF71_01675 [Actinomycetia bacterium]|nr:hypothetical protein [Actinomycetes bacterium]